MKTIINNLDGFISYNKIVHECYKETFSKEPVKPDERFRDSHNWGLFSNKKNNDIFLRILNEPYIKNRKEIMNKEFEKLSNEWNFAKYNLVEPYSISISDENNISIDWEEEIFDITIEKLCQLLKKYNKKYLKVYNGCSGWIGNQIIIEIENTEDYS